jgi:hypothetical protein
MRTGASPYHRIVLIATLIYSGCSLMPVGSGGWKRDAHSLALLPVGLEFAENVTNVTQQIEGKCAGSNRFQGVDFFEECFNSMSGRDRQWYALLYCAEHQLDGESLLTFRLTIKPELRSIRTLARRLSANDWTDIGVCLGVDAHLARKRVIGVFGVE